MLFRKSLMCAMMVMAVTAFNGCCGGPPETAKITEATNIKGWLLIGDWEFQGTLTNFTDNANDPWEFQGSLKFPTTGYSMAAPEITIAESNPEHVKVLLMVIPPAPGAAVETRKQELKLSLPFDVSEDATFEFLIGTHCNGQSSPCGPMNAKLAEQYSLDELPGSILNVQGRNFLGLLFFDPLNESWQLEGAFVFLTGGHTAEVVSVTSGGTPTTVTITMRVTPPRLGSVTPQFIQTVPISLSVDASVSTLFKVLIETGCP